MQEQVKVKDNNEIELRIDEQDLRDANGTITINVPITISVQIPNTSGHAVDPPGMPAARPRQFAVKKRLVSIGELDADEAKRDTDWSSRKGYNPLFLGKDASVPLPELNAKQKKAAAKLEAPAKNKDSYVLDYTHYSVVMNAERKLAFFSAGNIDGKKWFKIKRKEGTGGADKWYRDERIDPDAQVGNDLYANNEFDRGHLIRREYMTWGTREEALTANLDTFVFPNCSPQHEALNQGRDQWLGLEEYILTHAKNEAMKVSVFAGPIFGTKDPKYRETIRIPLAYWKVAVIKKDDGQLSATGYILHQERLARKVIDEEAAVLGDFNSFQVPITYISQKTRLDFGNLSKFDPLARMSDEELYDENPFMKGREITTFDDIVI